jgi:hypothetical protein
MGGAAVQSHKATDYLGRDGYRAQVKRYPTEVGQLLDGPVSGLVCWLGAAQSRSWLRLSRIRSRNSGVISVTPSFLAASRAARMTRVKKMRGTLTRRA